MSDVCQQVSVLVPKNWTRNRRFLVIKLQGGLLGQPLSLALLEHVELASTILVATAGRPTTQAQLQQAEVPRCPATRRPCTPLGLVASDSSLARNENSVAFSFQTSAMTL